MTGLSDRLREAYAASLGSHQDRAFLLEAADLIDDLVGLVHESLFHLRLDERAEDYHKRARAALAKVALHPQAGVPKDERSELVNIARISALVRRFRQLPLEGDAGCDKLTDDEWRIVARAALAKAKP